jgi:hypothetical protein
MINGGVEVFNLVPLRLHPTARLIAKIDKNKSLDFIFFLFNKVVYIILFLTKPEAGVI